MTSEDGIRATLGSLGERHSHVVGYLLVKGGMAEKVEQVRGAGGKVVRDVTEKPGAGRFAQFEDPEGNLVGLWQDWE